MQIPDANHADVSPTGARLLQRTLDGGRCFVSIPIAVRGRYQNEDHRPYNENGMASSPLRFEVVFQPLLYKTGCDHQAENSPDHADRGRNEYQTHSRLAIPVSATAPAMRCT